MGYGYWTRTEFDRYSVSRGRTVTEAGTLDAKLTDSQIFTQRGLNPLLDPKNVMRECRDSADHPESIPVILALDVTGSMGAASAEVAKKMNEVMTELYTKIRDVEFMVMGIGDLSYDRAPIQISQFESDIRIAEQLDLIYMEHGGGSNPFESYTAAWYMGARHTALDCLKHGRKGLIITMGDEELNPWLPRCPLSRVTGDDLQADVDTPALYREAAGKFEIFHLHVVHRQKDYKADVIRESFLKVLPKGHFEKTDLNGISAALVNIIRAHAEQNAGDRISWAAEKDAEPAKKGIFGIVDWLKA